MGIVSWIVALVCLAAALWLGGLNWMVFWKRHIRREEAPSWIPMLAGFLGVVGLTFLPVKALQAWFWLPILLDWGSIPGLAFSLLFLLFASRA